MTAGDDPVATAVREYREAWRVAKPAPVDPPIERSVAAYQEAASSYAPATGTVEKQVSGYAGAASGYTPSSTGLAGRQMAMDASDKADVLSCAFFRLWCPEGTAEFAELGGLTSEVEQTEYRETGMLGAMFSRHSGRSKPPTIVLRRAMKTGVVTTWLWVWHQLARNQLPMMQRDCSLTLYAAGDDPAGRGRFTYMLMDAFLAKMELETVKLGAAQVVVQSITLQCDDIIDPNVIDGTVIPAVPTPQLF